MPPVHGGVPARLGVIAQANVATRVRPPEPLAVEEMLEAISQPATLPVESTAHIQC